MTETEAYWDLVENDPRDWSRDQKVLYWWLAKTLVMMSGEGTILCPAPAPLTEEEIVEVLSTILQEGAGEYLNRPWEYINQSIITYTQTNEEVRVRDGAIRVAS